MEHFKFFQNRQCEYFPCHDVEHPEGFNCLFCYCPLYPLKNQCGGNFQYTENGIKDCSNCIVPHKKEGYDHVISHIGQLIETLGKE